MQIKRFVLSAPIFVCFAAALGASGQAASDVPVAGSVLDPSGAAIPGAALRFVGGAGERAVRADASGRFSVGLPAGVYEVSVEAAGFRTYQRTGLAVSNGRNGPLVIKLQIATAEEEVNVGGDKDLSNDAATNKSALVFKGDQLDTLSDDPSMMQQQLVAMGGNDPTNPPQLYVDGFSNGTMPPKQSIREIRINQNPFSAENDQFGMGRIEVFTKPGSSKLHGSLEFNYGDNSLNARNPYTGAPQPYRNDYTVGNVNGPLGKKMSYFVSAQRSDLSQNAVVNAVTLDGGLNPVTLSTPVSNEVVGQSYSGRLDRQFGAADTFIGRYEFSQSTQPQAGVGLLVLPSQAYASATRTQTLQLTDTHLFGAKVVLDAGLQYIRTRLRQDPVSTAASLVVQGSFADGGSPTQALHDNQDRLELQQYLSISHKTHFIRTGVRYRMLRDANLATAGYNGQFIFSDLTTYRNTLLDIQNGLSPQAIRAKGDGASQFSLSAGTPSASLVTGDVGVYAEDEWKARPDLTLTYGFRVESQSAIPDHFDFAPRLGFAYSVKFRKAAKEPALVLRGGFGMFYQRFQSGDILNSLRQNGVTQQVFYVTNPDFFPQVPSPGSLHGTMPTVYRISPQLRSPRQMQGMFTAEHSFGKYGSMAVNYYQRRSVHQFESLNLNAPLPGTGERPFGGTQNIYQYSSDGVSDGHTIAANANLNAGKRLYLWAYAGTGEQKTNTMGADSFPSDSYDLSKDEGEYPGYARRQLYAGINGKPGWGTAFNLFVCARSSTSFNITTGADNNNDSIYNDRPAFATDLSRASVVKTAFGNFDTDPLPGQTIIPINYGRGSSFFYLELYAHKSFHFGPREAAPAESEGHDNPATGGKKELPPPRYGLEFGIGADNLLNHVNPGTPVGILSSPFFGRSISLNAPFSQNTAANRAVTLRTAFYF